MKVIPISTSTITFDEFSKVDMIICSIISCEKVKNSTKLYKIEVDCGDKIGKKQVISGVAKYFQPLDLIGKQVVYVSNLLPKKMLDLESTGMLLFSHDKTNEKVGFVTISQKISNGTKVT